VPENLRFRVVNPSDALGGANRKVSGIEIPVHLHTRRQCSGRLDRLTRRWEWRGAEEREEGKLEQEQKNG
jgi:hypothetical protein